MRFFEQQEREKRLGDLEMTHTLSLFHYTPSLLVSADILRAVKIKWDIQWQEAVGHIASSRTLWIEVARFENFFEDQLIFLHHR